MPPPNEERQMISEQQSEILDLLMSDPGLDWSPAEIARDLEMRPSVVVGRLNEMMQAGYISEAAGRSCKVTGGRITPVRVLPC